MKIVTHVARDMRQAMRAIRERLGENAVILSSRRVTDGVEVTAAVDFEAAQLSSQSAAPPPEAAPAPAPDSLPLAQEVGTFPDTASAAADETLFIRREVRAALLEPVQPREVTAPARVGILTKRPESSPPVIFMAPPTQASGKVPPSQPENDARADARALEEMLTPRDDGVKAAANDLITGELKTLRRMLETQLAQLAWNEMTRKAPVHTEMLRELSEIGISSDLASHITDQLPQDVDLTAARRFAIGALAQYLNVTGDRWLEDGARIAFIGATGVGKTTTLAKLAARWVLRHGPSDLALVAADGTRLGAQDQMQSLGQLLGAPVYTPEDFASLPALLGRLRQRFILIDTPGSSMRDPPLTARLAVLADCASQLQTALVLSASTQSGALEEAVKRFGPANPTCCVLTKLDEAVTLGGALSVLIRTRLPISYLSEGQRIPEDLRPARALELVSSAVRLAKTSGATADEDLLRRRFGRLANAIS